MNQLETSKNLINPKSITALLILVTIGTLVALVLWPNFQEFNIIQKSIEAAEVELEGKQNYILSLDKLKVKLDENQESLAKIETALPDDPTVSSLSLSNYLQKITSQSGLILSEAKPFSVAEEKDSSGLRPITFDLKVSGSYPSFKEFLLILEKSARLIEVETISFETVTVSSSGEGESSVETVKLPTFNLSLKAFSY